MTTSRTTRTLATAALAAFAAVGTFAAERDASADVRVRIGGSAHIRVGGSVRVRAPRVRVRIRRPPPPPPIRVHVGGAIWVGGGWHARARFAAPPPEPVCDCGPSNGSYYPIAPQPTESVAVMAPVARPELPRWGLGVAAGGVDVEGEAAGDDLAVLGRYRLTPGLLVEGELGKNELADGSRVDRRLGASLVYEIGAYNRWAPYVVGGLGVTQVDVGDGVYQSNQSFGEAGIGLRWAVSPRVHLAADVRAGSRAAVDNAPMPLDAQYRSVTPTANESEEYTRMRLAAVLYF